MGWNRQTDKQTAASHRALLCRLPSIPRPAGAQQRPHRRRDPAAVPAARTGDARPPRADFRGPPGQGQLLGGGGAWLLLPGSAGAPSLPPFPREQDGLGGSRVPPPLPGGCERTGREQGGLGVRKACFISKWDRGRSRTRRSQI